MSLQYVACLCGSGKKFKFCCFNLLMHGSREDLNRVVSQFPIVTCVTHVNWQQVGLMTLYVVRALPNGNYIFGSYLLDIWFLGVKNADLRKNISESVLVALLEKFKAQQSVVQMSYEQARTLAFGSCKYAQQFGIKPHADWALAQALLEPDRSFEENFIFGRNGKPFYQPGPYDGVHLAEYKRKVIEAGGSCL